ncbi:adaptin n terminal region domain-containing protein [Cystoisospora suis]|uniref:Adaptin n terminal region domain-containing protein n=1 Tax=Cystoisospora suis TaxID=483139 RepID=A0A2C6L341_9APIC|nr:adaptin n terminal region domain-containing protein [Cystoisospora suis]
MGVAVSSSFFRACVSSTRDMLIKEEEEHPSSSSLCSSEGGDKKFMMMRIPPRQSIAYRIRLRCMQPFLNLPPIPIHISSLPPSSPQSGPTPPGVSDLNISSSVNLPVVFTNFIEPSRGVNTPEMFLKLWARLGKKTPLEEEEDEDEENEKNEREVVITRPLGIPVQHIGVYVQGGFHLQPVKIRRSLCGSGTFYTGTALPKGMTNFSPSQEDLKKNKNKKDHRQYRKTSKEEQQFVTAFLMCMIEVNPHSQPMLGRLTVRSTHPRVSLFFSQLLSSFLLLSPPSSSQQGSSRHSSGYESSHISPPPPLPSGAFPMSTTTTTTSTIPSTTPSSYNSHNTYRPPPSSSSSLPPPFPGGGGGGFFSSPSPTAAGGGGGGAIVTPSFPSSSSSSSPIHQRQQQAGVVGGFHSLTVPLKPFDPPNYCNYPAAAPPPTEAVNSSNYNSSRASSSFYYA